MEKDKKTKIISFINMKGGVGKTTLCVGLGEYLANFKSKRILIIDLDPQFNSTQTLMDSYGLTEEYMKNYRQNKTVRLIFKEPELISKPHVLPSKESVIVSLSSDELGGKLDIICGTIDLIKDDDSKKSKYKRIKKFIKNEVGLDDYDYIFVDCPPTISFFTDAAIYASDYYLVPTKIDRYSILGITLLSSVIEDAKFDDELNIKPLGIIYTNYSSNDHPTKKEKDIIKIFEDRNEVQNIGIFHSKFHYCKDLMVGKSGNIASKYKKSKEDLEKIASEFLSKINEDD